MNLNKVRVSISVASDEVFHGVEPSLLEAVEFCGG